MNRPALWLGAGVALVLDVLLVARVTGLGLHLGAAWVLAVAVAATATTVIAVRRTVRRDHELNTVLSARWQATLENTRADAR